MARNLAAKVIFIVVLTAAAIWTLYPPAATLKPGIDLAGGTSLIYEIDTTGMEPGEQRDLAERMITVLRRRIDPANIQNLVWRPLGSTRFEIQMPLASAEARQKRAAYQQLLQQLLSKNVRRSRILLALRKDPNERSKEFQQFAAGSEQRMQILNELAAAYDQLTELRKQRDELAGQLKQQEGSLSAAGLDVQRVKGRVGEWVSLTGQQFQEALRKFAGPDANSAVLARYVQTYKQWAGVEQQLTDPETGANKIYEEKLAAVDQLNLSEEQINYVLEMEEGSALRRQALEKLKTQFSDRADMIDQLVKAFDEYRPYRGRLDDPQDLQRMLTGAGILEFRVLPTITDSQLDTDRINRYLKNLQEKGPKYASDDQYIWFEIENINEWAVPNAIVGRFGEKYYVLCSNRPDEKMVHSGGERQWKLERAYPTQDRMGRRAIGFRLDERGAALIGRVSGKNIGRPFCILLDSIAISAPKIESRLRRDSIITGTFTRTEVDDMVNKLNAGSLPARLIEQPIMVRTIGPSIGADNRDRGIKAGLIGLAAVVVVMAVYYTLAGSIADVALLLNILLVLASMALLRATFTLPGIAGIILTIGMSVDANVLIFERIREEQKRGSSLQIAVRNGYQQAFRTIFDANLTTFITAAILYWRASEEVKGFAIVLMLGIASSMFTALFVTRVIFDLLLSKRWLKEHLVMLQMVGRPKVNWMRARGGFFALSTLLIVAGLFVFFTRDDTRNNKYDIEFTGGTSVQIELKDGVSLTRQQVEAKIHQVGAALDNPALQAVNVYSVGEAIGQAPSGEKIFKRYEITTTETNKTIATIELDGSGEHTVQSVRDAIRKAQAGSRTRLNNLSVRRVGTDSAVFEIATSQLNASAVKQVLAKAFPNGRIVDVHLDQVVNNAILSAFEGQLVIKESLQPEIASRQQITEAVIETHPELADYLGGAAIQLRLGRATTARDMLDRLASLRFKPDMRGLEWSYDYVLLDAGYNKPPADKKLNEFIYVSVAPQVGSAETDDEQWQRFVENETRKLTAAAELATSLPSVTQIDPSVGAEAKTRAMIAIVLSLFAILAYIWLRFGSVRYSFGAIVALVHDVCITLGAVTVCTYIASSRIGQALLIGDFKIDLAMIAAFLTLIGYSLNDTIVVFDRIRENRKKGPLRANLITDSINQTISRTLMTSLTTFIVVLIMYIFGGPGLRGFTFAIGFGVIIGTYSSIAIAAPVLLLGGTATTQKSK